MVDDDHKEILTMNRDREVRAHAEPYRDKINLDVDPQRFMPRNRTAPMKSLPLDFKPTPYSVIVGRGKLCTDSVGNRRLRVLATTFLQKYSDASTSKIEKSTTVSRIVEITQEACPVGAFIKLDDGRWWEVADHTAREKVGYVIRDLLGDTYRSSSKSKVVARCRTSGGLSPRRRKDSLTPPSPSATKKKQGGNKHRAKSHSRRYASATFQEGPATIITNTAPSRPPSNTEEKKDLVLGDLGGLEQKKKYPKSSIQSDVKKKSLKAQECHLLVLAGAAEMTDFSSLSLNLQERNGYARAESRRSMCPASILPFSGDLDGKYSSDNMFPRAASRNPIQANTVPRSSGYLDGQYSIHNEPNIPFKSSCDLEGKYSRGSNSMFARATHIPSQYSSIVPSIGELDQRYCSADSMFAHAAKSPMRGSIFPSSGDQLDGKYLAEGRPFFGSNHNPVAGAVLAPDEELGGSNNLIKNDGFLRSFLDQHVPSPVPLHAGALSRPIHQATEYASTRIGGDPMQRNSVHREFDWRAPRNEYLTQEFFPRQLPLVFNSVNSERLEFRRRVEATPMEPARSLRGESSNHLSNEPNLSDPWPSSSQTHGHDDYYENISNIFD